MITDDEKNQAVDALDSLDWESVKRDDLEESGVDCSSLHD